MERSARLNSGVGLALYWLKSFASMSMGGGIGSAVAAAAVSLDVRVIHDGDAADDTADAGVGGPDLEYMAGDMELCLLLL
jgi:hypothetical protein